MSTGEEIKPYYQDNWVTIYHCDCFEIMPQLKMVDHVITDPPYTQRVSDGARTGRVEKLLVTFDGIDGLEPQIAKICLEKVRRWCIIFCAFEQVGIYSDAAGKAYVRVGVWRKLDATPQFSGDRPAMCGEACVILHGAEKKKWNGGGYPAYWECLTERNRLGHPTPKPLKLIKTIMLQFTDPEETIVDPFMGSGTTLRSAKDLQRKAIGIEIEEKYCEIAAKRMSQEVLPL